MNGHELMLFIFIVMIGMPCMLLLISTLKDSISDERTCDERFFKILQKEFLSS